MTFEKKFEQIKAKLVAANAQVSDEYFAIQFNMTDTDCAGTFYIVCRGGALEIEPYDYRDRTAEVTASANTIVRLLDGRTSFDSAVASGKMAIMGNIDHVKSLSGIARAKK